MQNLELGDKVTINGVSLDGEIQSPAALGTAV